MADQTQKKKPSGGGDGDGELLVEPTQPSVVAASSEMEGSQSLFDESDKEPERTSWAESESDLVVDETQPDPMDVEESAHESEFMEVRRRGIKRVSSPIPRHRSRSLPRSSARLARAKEIIQSSLILTEERKWFSCVGEDCRMHFQRYRDFLSHFKECHPTITVRRFPCPLKHCTMTCNNPREWINHLASRHPDFVSQHDTTFFDKFFVRR